MAAGGSRPVYHKIHIAVCPAPAAAATGLVGDAAAGPAAAPGGGGRQPVTLTLTQIDVTEQVEAQDRLGRLLEQEHKVGGCSGMSGYTMAALLPACGMRCLGAA